MQMYTCHGPDSYEAHIRHELADFWFVMFFFSFLFFPEVCFVLRGKSEIEWLSDTLIFTWPCEKDFLTENVSGYCIISTPFLHQYCERSRGELIGEILGLRVEVTKSRGRRAWWWWLISVYFWQYMEGKVGYWQGIKLALGRGVEELVLLSRIMKRKRVSKVLLT